MLSSCESELMELMRQIDMMMQSKKMEWDAEKRGMAAKLEVKEQECNVSNAMLEQKAQEVLKSKCM